MKIALSNINPPDIRVIQAIIKAQNRHFRNSKSMWSPCCLAVGTAALVSNIHVRNEKIVMKCLIINEMSQS